MRIYRPADIVNAVVSRRWLVLLPCAVGIALAPWLAGLITEKYRSETLIMVVPQRVPDSYVKATVTETIEDRLPSISDQILSRSRLEVIITEMNLYPERRATQVMEDVVAAMRSDVTVALAGQRSNADSFRVSYVSENPETARRVTERLASLYIEQNLRDRENQATSTSQFLETQLQDAKQRLIDQEKKLEEYRRQHAGELPTQLQGNLQAIQNTNLQLQALNESMNRALERRLLIERQLADTKDSIAIEPLPAPVSGTAQTATTTSQRLAAARGRLAGLLQYYTPDHPEVVTVRRLVEELERQTEAETPLGSVDGTESERPLSPAQLEQRKRIQDLQGELLVIDKQLELNRAEEARLRQIVSSVQARVDALPTRESELVELTRDYSTLQAAYGSLLTKREDSTIAANLERRQIGEQFRIIDPASRPEKPFNEVQRLGMMVSGVALGLVLGLMLVGIQEFRDGTFRSEDEVAAALSLPVLALIPVMASPRETAKARRRRLWIDIAGSTALLAALTIVVVWRLRS